MAEAVRTKSKTKSKIKKKTSKNVPDTTEEDATFKSICSSQLISHPGAKTEEEKNLNVIKSTDDKKPFNEDGTEKCNEIESNSDENLPAAIQQHVPESESVLAIKTVGTRSESEEGHFDAESDSALNHATEINERTKESPKSEESESFHSAASSLVGINEDPLESMSIVSQKSSEPYITAVQSQSSMVSSNEQLQSADIAPNFYDTNTQKQKEEDKTTSPTVSSESLIEDNNKVSLDDLQKVSQEEAKSDEKSNGLEKETNTQEPKEEVKTTPSTISPEPLIDGSKEVYSLEDQKVSQQIAKSDGKRVLGEVTLRKPLEREINMTGIGLQHMNLNPGISKAPVPRPMVPFCKDTLLIIYANSELIEKENIIEKFLETEERKENHPFEDIISSFLRARKSLILAEEEVMKFQTDYLQYQDQVWITSKANMQAKGVCGDGHTCKTTHLYDVVNFLEENFHKMKTSLENIRHNLQNQLALQSYSVQLARLQVDTYLHNLFNECPLLRDIPKDAPISGLLVDYGIRERQQINRLKDCVTVLFHFHRKPISDQEFINSIRQWTQKLVAALLKIATLEDHLFVLNHVLRCPAGVGQWAANLIQIPPFPKQQPSSNIVCPELNHLIACLAFILQPIKGRERFLSHMKEQSDSKEPGGNSSAWIMVDSDGEEDEDPQNAWLYLKENDVVDFLRQIPLNVLFQRILMIEEQSSGKLHYDINRTDDKIMLRVFAICRCLIDLLDCGLQSFSIMRYRQLNKRIGRSIRQTVQYVSNHWESFHNRFSGVLPMDIMERIDLEYSQFFLQATNCILHAQKLGCWQFMTEMPYHTVTKEMSWQLMWLFHQNVRDYINVDQMPKETECKQILTDKNSRQQLCDNIQNLSVSESIYLMTAIMNLSEARSPDQSDLIQVATLSIFEVCYVCNQTREQFSKAGREILASLAVTHPFIVSLLIHATNEHMAQIGQMAKYLYSDMPMESWIPREPDMDILSNWLLSPSMIEPQHLAARAIIACINWGHDKEERHLLLPSSFHKRCAVLLSEAYGKFVFSRSVGYWFLDGMKQAAAAVKQQETLEQQFHNGAWDITLKLHLHMGSLPHSDYLLAMSGGGPPELSADNMLLAISKGVKDRNPLACYVAIMSSKIGHSFGEFLSQGLDALQVLSDSHNYRQAHHVLFYTCSLFMERPDPLIQNDIFTRIFQTLLSADESFLKVCKLWSSDFPGPMLKLFVSMIECKIQKCSQKSTAEMVKLLHLWIKAVLHLPKWYSDRNACYLLDMLVRCSFAFKVNLETLESQFKPAFENHYKESTQHGTVSSFVNWVSSGTYCTFGTSLTEKLYSPGDFPWLTFLLLTVELKSENESKVWEAFREDIHMDPKLAFEQILKKAASKLKLDYCPALNSLNIFGWANLCLETDMDHPLLPLIWQRFFLLFLGRSLNPSSLQQRASVGEKLFETGKYYSQRKKMKKKLKEIAQFHLKRVSEITASEIQDIREQDLPNTNTSDSYHAKKEFHQELARIYQTYELWIEEPVLHDSKLYLPALPPQYNADLLLKLFQNNTDLWLMFIDYDRVIHSVNESSAYWLQSLQGSSSSQLPKDSGRNKGAKSASQRILERLTKHDTPEPLPPTSPVLGAGVPETGINILHNKSNVMHIIKMDLSVLQDFAESFERRVSHHVACDEDFNKLVPKLFYNQLKQVQLTIPCKSMLNPLHKCINPAVVVINVSEKSKVENIQRQMDENRAEFKQLMAQGVSPPPQKICVSAVHVENIITEFIKLSRATTDANKKAYYSDIASNLFFHLAESFDINVQFYPPTKQFFSACLDILGMEFIQKDPSQTESVLEFSLQNPSMAGHISPHFVPLNRPQRYITMYERLVQILQRDAPELVFSLLTKFDINLWMTSHDLTVKEVQRFSEVLGAALCACGPDMEDKTSLVFELYKSHLKIFLLHNFPSNVPLVVDLILKGTVDQRLHVDCIQLLYKECFKSTFMKGDESSSAAFVPIPSTLLSIETLRGIMKQFAGFYSHLRLSSTELSSFGLYSQMMPYVPVYIDLFRDISICSLQLVSYGLNVENASQALLSCWQSVIDLYIPWMQTLVFDNKFLFPWIQEDAENAKSVLDSFCSVISQFHQVFSGYLMPYQMSVLCLLWQYYCQILCIKQTPSHVTMVFAATFKQLPWEQLRPDIHTINLMLKLKDVNSADSFELLAEIVCKMNWNEIVQYYHDNHFGPGFSHVLSCVLTLLIQCFGDQKHIEIPELTWCMQKAESYDWSQLSFDSFRHASNWLLQTCDPICVIQGRSSPIAQGIRLLKCASGFDVQSSRLWNNELSMKRQSYVHTAVQLICQCTYTEEVKSETLSTAILNFLTEIETVESSVVNPMFQRGESQDIMKNFLGLLNNCNPDNNSQTTVMTTILDWLRGSQKSILLIPFIKASFCSLASHQHIIIIVEECIHVFLNAESESGVKWDPLLEVIQVPDLNPERFLEDALQEGAFLLLYAHLVLQEPLLVSPAEKQKMISSIINWIRNAKPSPTKEAKILMLWYKALERVLHQIDCGLNQGICIPWLNALIITFQMWGEDRASEGLLGAIGLGKKSPLSLKFRVIARALAALLSNQVLNQSKVRLQPSDPMPSNNSQNKALTKALQDLRTNRSYQAYLPQIQVACDQVSNPNTCLYNSVQLLAQLACEFYPSEKYLTTIASSRTVFGS